jgi:hypothetical protein
MTTYPITKDDYFDRQQPAKTEELRNVVRVVTQPLVAEESEDPIEVFRTDEAEPVSVPAGGSITIEVVYNTCPVMNAVFDLEEETAGVTISGTPIEYAWGASVTLANSGGSVGTALVVVTGDVLKVDGEQTIEKLNQDSIDSNGRQLYEYPENHLVQTKVMADQIATALLSSYKDPRKDTQITWRGDMAMELGDKIEVPIYQRGAIDTRGDFVIYKQKIVFDGTLKMTTDARKVA